MPRTQVKGTLVCDGSILSADLADDAVITAKILDSNVTESKLSDDISVRLLSSSKVIGRERFISEIPSDTDVTIPGGFTWDSAQDFIDRFVLILNGQVLNSGSGAPTDGDWIDVYPGSASDKVRFPFLLRKGSKIQVMRL
jgi:hypothetical protein